MSIPQDEFARQRELDTYRVVDTFPEAAYDDIVRLATILCGTPIALISLIDRDRQWFKARTGFELREGRRDEAFCEHAIRSPDLLLEVPDARADPRFADNPLVTGGPAIRFYAGMPLVTPSGAPIGTVCVIDSEPRSLDDTQRAGLAALARITMNLLEARHRERELRIAALLEAEAGAAPATSPDPAPAVPATIAIFEVVELAAAAARLGDRALARAMRQLEQVLEAALAPGSGDSVSHATGGADMVVVLHGADAAQALERLREAVAGFERDSTLSVLSAAAVAESPDEPLVAVFARADEALSLAKDERCAALER